MLNQVNYTTSHIYKEGNSCADFLAKLGITLNEYLIFNGENCTENLVSLIQLDKPGIIYQHIS